MATIMFAGLAVATFAFGKKILPNWYWRKGRDNG
jgi:hypothetical protein